ncbi:fas-associated death domain protein isoform X2 [Nomia melanderi]|uniref:fas-associated death domain protein isoform X2 n=1 Tax=Nomia melanderi TaxID=2448451 RepID=UPI003FCE83DA
MNVQVKYHCLLTEFLSVAQLYINDTVLLTLKDYYEHHINSKRKLSQIKDLKALIKCSKFCDMYQDDNEPEHKESLKEVDIQSESTESEWRSALQSSTSTSTLYSHPEQDTLLQQKVLSQICERIGRSWRDTARYLGIPEYQIEIIQHKYPSDMREQSYQALNLCISKYSTDNWKLSLIHALEKARRRDLKELVEKLVLK